MAALPGAGAAASAPVREEVHRAVVVGSGFGAVIGPVCDPWGRVHDNPGLYVTDGALIPGSTACCNPSYTIAALAERCLARITHEDVGTII